MPSTARVTYRYPDGETATEALRPTDDGTFRGRVDSATRPFSFRVAAGDDVTESIEVAVVPPPVLERTTVRLVAPGYTDLKPMMPGPGEHPGPGGRGDPDRVRGHREQAHRLGPATAGGPGRQGAGEDRGRWRPALHRVHGPVVAAVLGRAEATPRDSAARRYVRFDIRALKDEAPRVTIDDPSHDRDVPAEATVPIDDHGRRRLRHPARQARLQDRHRPVRTVSRRRHPPLGPARARRRRLGG